MVKLHNKKCTIIVPCVVVNLIPVMYNSIAPPFSFKNFAFNLKNKIDLRQLKAQPLPSIVM